MSARAIVIGPTRITPHDVGLEAQYHPASSWEQAYHLAQRALVVRELLLLECQQRGITKQRPTNERDAQWAVTELIDHALPEANVDDTACRGFYEQHPDRFLGAPLYDASHILLAAAANDAPSRAVAKARAETLRAEIVLQPSRFERRARELSGCPSAANDGRLGQISPGETEPEFEAALLSLDPGELSQVIETSSGFHIIRLEARAAAERLPFDLVKAKIRLYLEEREFRAALHGFVLELAQKHGVEGFDLLAEAPTPRALAISRGPRRLAVVRG